jgi:hypothetical protein
VSNANRTTDPPDPPVLAYGSATATADTYHSFMQRNLKWLFPLQVLHAVIVLAGIALTIAATFDIESPSYPALSKLAPLPRAAFYWNDLNLMNWACCGVSLFGTFAMYRARRTQSINTRPLHVYALSAPLLFAIDLAAQIILVLASPIALVATPLTATYQTQSFDYHVIAEPVILLLPAFIVLILWAIARFWIKRPLT